LIEFGLLALEKKILGKRNVSVFLLFSYYLPLDRGNTLHLNRLESPPQRRFVPSLVKISPVVLKKIFK
jgi:hypothetical protein